jgi:hypothetical protein
LVIQSDSVWIGIDALIAEMAKTCTDARVLLARICARISSSVDMAEERAERTKIREKRKAEEGFKDNNKKLKDTHTHTLFSSRMEEICLRTMYNNSLILTVKKTYVGRMC